MLVEDNRIREYLSDLNNRTNDPEEMMMEIMEALNDAVTPIPEVGKFYTFVYKVNIFFRFNKSNIF